MRQLQVFELVDACGRIDGTYGCSRKPCDQYSGELLLGTMAAIEEVDCRAAHHFQRSVIGSGSVVSVPGLNGQREHGQIGFQDTRD